jgi:DnaJ domain
VSSVLEGFDIIHFKLPKSFVVFAFFSRLKTQQQREAGLERQRKADRAPRDEMHRESTNRRDTERQRQEEIHREYERQREANHQRRRQKEAEAERQRKLERAERKQNWSEVLGVSPAASADEIKRTYRRKIKEYHPDRFAGRGPEWIALAEHHTKALNAAYAQAKRARA